MQENHGFIDFVSIFGVSLAPLTDASQTGPTQTGTAIRPYRRLTVETQNSHQQKRCFPLHLRVLVFPSNFGYNGQTYCQTRFNAVRGLFMNGGRLTAFIMDNVRHPFFVGGSFLQQDGRLLELETAALCWDCFFFMGC